MRIDKIIVSDMLSQMNIVSANLNQEKKGSILLKHNIIKEIPQSGFWNTLDNLTESGIELFKKVLQPYKDANKVPIEIVPKQDLEKMLKAAGVKIDFDKLNRKQIIEKMNKLEFFLPGYRSYTNRTFTEKGKKIYNEVVGFDFFDLEEQPKEKELPKKELEDTFTSVNFSNPFGDAQNHFAKTLFEKVLTIGPGFEIVRMDVKINPENHEDYSSSADVIFRHCKIRTVVSVGEHFSHFVLKDEHLDNQVMRMWLDCDSMNQEWKITRFDSSPYPNKNEIRQDINGMF